VVKYEKLLETGTVASAGPLRRPNGTRLQSRDAYEELCQHPGGQVGLAGGTDHGPPPHRCPPSHAPLGPVSPQPAPEQLPHLGCSYETNGSPYLLLQPAKKEMIRIRPYVALYHDFISDAEAETIKGLAGPWVSRPCPQGCPSSGGRCPRTWQSRVDHPEHAEIGGVLSQGLAKAFSRLEGDEPSLAPSEPPKGLWGETRSMHAPKPLPSQP